MADAEQFKCGVVGMEKEKLKLVRNTYRAGKLVLKCAVIIIVAVVV